MCLFEGQGRAYMATETQRGEWGVVATVLIWDRQRIWDQETGSAKLDVSVGRLVALNEV